MQPPYGAPSPPPAPQQQFTPPPVGSYGGAPAPAQASGEAVAALVCGIGGWFCFPLGFVAVWLGARARRAARENPGRVGGEQMALAGMIIGGVLGGLQLLLILVYVLMIVFAVGFAATAGP